MLLEYHLNQYNVLDLCTNITFNKLINVFGLDAYCDLKWSDSYEVFKVMKALVGRVFSVGDVPISSASLVNMVNLFPVVYV